LEDSFESRQVFEEILELRFAIQSFENLCSFEAHWQSSVEKPDLVIADLRLPDGNFLNFIRNQTAKKRVFPAFIVISSVDDVDIIRASFDHGALDYLVKPIKKTELLVKIERLLKTDLPPEHDSEEKIEIDPIRMIVKKSEGPQIKLTAKELKIFTLIYESEGNRTSRAYLFEKVWGEIPNSEKTLDVHLSNLRQKIIELGLEISFLAPETYAILPILKI
jgi:DNA-binding response OmpR family regulator